MRRSIWIFLASIFLPSLGLAWLATRSAQDQQVLLEHQQVLLTQNTTDSLAQNIQARMQQVRDDFAGTTQQLLAGGPSPQGIAENFDRLLCPAWPMAQLGFAVNLDRSEIYSPKSYESPAARLFRSENDRFLTNRENAEVYSSKQGGLAQNFNVTQKAIVKNDFVPTAPETSPSSLASRTIAVAEAISAPSDDVDKSAHGSLAPMSDARPDAASPSQNFPQVSAGRGKSSLASASTSVPVTPDISSPQTASPLAASSGIQVPAAARSASAGAQGKVPAPSTDTGEIMSASLADGSSVPPPDKIQTKAILSPALSASATASHQAASPDDTLLDKATSAQLKPVFVKDAPLGSSAAPTHDENKSAASTTANTASPVLEPPLERSSVAFTDLTKSPDARISVPGSTTSLEAGLNQIARQVQPQQFSASNAQQVLSNTVPEESDFRRVIGAGPSGILARFIEDKLQLMVWFHSADSGIVFGAQLDPTQVAAALQDVITASASPPAGTNGTGPAEYCVALLDDTGHPVAVSLPGFHGDWKHPFVATEIGEVLPHWEAALYLVDPHQIDRAAGTLRATLALIVLVLVAAIVSGGSLIAADVRRQMRLAQQKTDFVSNVSHELKTPLTSIRMFADLLAEQRVPDEQRQSTYLRIISAEAARLTRLINNVLDFARLERGSPPGEHRDGDLAEAVRDVVETCAPHLEASGIAFHHEVEAETLPIRGDRDALAQITLNLISNAEKYGGSEILVRVRRQETPTGALGCVDVLDRGPGVPAAQARAIFEPFHRLDDSLASGIPGSGLGLTLARRMARSHGGEVSYAPRAGGGSCFTLSVPLRAT